MGEYITFKEHPVAAAEAQVFFSPPYLLQVKSYEAIFAVLNAHNFSVLECQRDDLEMTRDPNGMQAVLEAMTERLQSITENVVIDVGMSLGAGFTALAREHSQTKPAARLVLSPVPDPVLPWDEGRFSGALNALNNRTKFVAGVGNYQVLKVIKAANYNLDSSIPTYVVAETSRGMNAFETIQDWAERTRAEVSRCLYAHGTFRRGPLSSHLPFVLARLKSQLKI